MFPGILPDYSATIHTHKELDYTRAFPELTGTVRDFDICIIDGEICAVDKDGATNFSLLQSAMKSDKTDRLVYFAFDLPFDGDEDLR